MRFLHEGLAVGTAGVRIALLWPIVASYLRGTITSGFPGEQVGDWSCAFREGHSLPLARCEQLDRDVYSLLHPIYAAHEHARVRHPYLCDAGRGKQSESQS